MKCDTQNRRPYAHLETIHNLSQRNIKAAAAELGASGVSVLFHNDLGCPLLLNLLLLSLFPLSLLNINVVTYICFPEEVQPHHVLIMSLAATRPHPDNG